MTIPVNEIFETIQGEANYTGTPSVFIRLQGCPIGCGWCDTKHTWAKGESISTADMLQKTEDAATYADLSVSELMDILSGYSAKHVVITGGEPFIHDLGQLTVAIYGSGRTVQIETSGTHPTFMCQRSFLTVSPKINMPGGFKLNHNTLARADEIKMPVGKQKDIDLLVEHVLPHINPHAPIWLQPLSQNKSATELCVQTAIKRNWKISIQTHKFIGVR